MPHAEDHEQTEYDDWARLDEPEDGRVWRPVVFQESDGDWPIGDTCDEAIAVTAFDRHARHRSRPVMLLAVLMTGAAVAMLYPRAASLPKLGSAITPLQVVEPAPLSPPSASLGDATAANTALRRAGVKALPAAPAAVFGQPVPAVAEAPVVMIDLPPLSFARSAPAELVAIAAAAASPDVGPVVAPIGPVVPPFPVVPGIAGPHRLPDTPRAVPPTSALIPQAAPAPVKVAIEPVVRSPAPPSVPVPAEPEAAKVALPAPRVEDRPPNPIAPSKPAPAAEPSQPAPRAKRAADTPSARKRPAAPEAAAPKQAPKQGGDHVRTFFFENGT